MISENELLEIGYISKNQGKGEQVVCRMTNLLFDDAQTDFLILRVDGLFVPFRIESFRYKGEHDLILSLKGITTISDAQALIGATAFVPRNTVTINPDQQYNIESLIGYHIIDDQYGVVGQIEHVDTTTQNTLFFLSNGKILPAHEDFISGIDTQAMKIFVSMPQGLFE